MPSSSSPAPRRSTRGDAERRRALLHSLLDCDDLGTRAVNQALRSLPERSRATVSAPRGRHNLAVGLAAPIAVTVEGNAGYFLGGLCGHQGRQRARHRPSTGSWAGRWART